jgi:hypothetical protein
MARNGSGVYSLPANTAAVSGDPVSSTKFNSLVQDLEADANVDRPIAAGGTGASTASGARTNLGITGNLYDVTASAFALTILDDADAAAVRTTIGAGAGDMLKSENLSGLANYTTARSNLGLGTAAVVNTGTSGATIPLLNAANTWSGAQTFGNSGIVLNGDGGTNRQFLIQSGFVNRWVYGVEGSAEAGSNAGTNYIIARFSDAGSFLDIPLTITRSTGAVLFSTTPSVAGSTVWHAGNDGAGSSLDADTVDGIQASALVQTTGAQSVSGTKTFTSAMLVNGGTARFEGSDSAPIGGTGVGVEIIEDGTNGIIQSFNRTSPAFTPLNLKGSVIMYDGKNLARVNSGNAANSGKISWGTAAPGTLAEGEIYLRHA